jgi:hypothetical protein
MDLMESAMEPTITSPTTIDSSFSERERKRKRLILALSFILYSFWVSILIYRHEVWRDEARALSIVRASSSLSELFANLKNEGHPALWYLLLKGGYLIFQAPWSLKVVHLLIAISAAFVWLFFSPFLVYERIFFLCGIAPVFEFSVISRNYGISTLLMFLIAHLYPRKWERPVFYCSLMALLANTNVHSLIFAGALFAGGCVEYLRAFRKSHTNKPKWNVIVISSLIFLSGSLLSIYTIYPDQYARAGQPFHHDLASVLLQLWSVFTAPFDFLNFNLATLWLDRWNTFILPEVIIFSALIPSMTIELYLILILATVGVSFFFSAIYVAHPRHQFLYLNFFLAIWWIKRARIKNIEFFKGGRRSSLFVFGDRILLFIFLFILFNAAWDPIRNATLVPYSNVKKFSGFLASQPEFKASIIIAEPDYLIEALPYYADNQMYSAREERFVRWVHFTSENKDFLSTNEMLDQAETLQKKTGKTVVFVIENIIDMNKPHLWHLGRKQFDNSPDGVLRFRNSTKMIADFSGALSDENFKVYCLMPCP